MQEFFFNMYMSICIRTIHMFIRTGGNRYPWLSLKLTCWPRFTYIINNIHICMYISIHICMYISIHIYMYVCIYVCVYLFICVCVYIYLFICVCVCLYIHT